MTPPTVEESYEQIRARGIHVAREILSEQGIVFREAATAEEAADITENEVERFRAEENFQASAAALLQTHKFIDESRAREVAAILCQGGDGFFYDDYDCEGALQTFQLAAALAPQDHASIRGVITVCLQGDGDRRLDVALPYAVISAHLGARNDLNYVLKLIHEENV